MKVELIGGRFDGEFEEIGDVAPEKLTRLVVEEAGPGPGEAVPTVEYLRTKRTRGGCVVYVLKGAAL